MIARMLWGTLGDARMRLGLATLLGCVSTTLVFAGAADAAPVTVTVHNEQNIPQASVARAADGTTRGSDRNGRLSLDLEPGQTVQIQRAGQQPCYGTDTVTYTATGATEAAVNLSTLSYRNNKYPQYAKPDLQNEERALVGMINNERKAKGLAPLRISTTLSRVADASIIDGLTHEYSGGVFDECWHKAINALVIDNGLNVAYRGEANDQTGSAKGAISIMQIRPNGKDGQPLYLDPSFTMIGVGLLDTGVSFVIYNASCPADLMARCAVTDDIGDASLAKDPEASNSNTASGPRNPKLRTRAITVSRRASNGRKTITPKLAVRDGVKGTFTVTAYRAAKTKTGKIRYTKTPARKIRSTRSTLKLRLRPGAYQLNITFTPKNTTRFKTVTTTKKLRVR